MEIVLVFGTSKPYLLLVINGGEEGQFVNELGGDVGRKSGSISYFR